MSSPNISAIIGRKLESKVKDIRGRLDEHDVRISNMDKIQVEHEKRLTKAENIIVTLDSRTLNMEEGINTLLGRDHISIRQSRGRGKKNDYSNKNSKNRATGSEKSDIKANAQSNQTSRRKQKDKINYDERGDDEFENADEEDNSTENRENKRRNEATNQNNQNQKRNVIMDQHSA